MKLSDTVLVGEVGVGSILKDSFGIMICIGNVPDDGNVPEELLSMRKITMLTYTGILEWFVYCTTRAQLDEFILLEPMK